MNPTQFYKCLSDETRLKSILLIAHEEELCVCEITEALQVSQPKISRHLAQLRECELLRDRRNGKWIFYRINSMLPQWAMDVIALTIWILFKKTINDSLTWAIVPIDINIAVKEKHEATFYLHP